MLASPDLSNFAKCGWLTWTKPNTYSVWILKCVFTGFPVPWQPYPEKPSPGLWSRWTVSSTRVYKNLRYRPFFYSHVNGTLPRISLPILFFFRLPGKMSIKTRKKENMMEFSVLKTSSYFPAYIGRFLFVSKNSKIHPRITGNVMEFSVNPTK